MHLRNRNRDRYDLEGMCKTLPDLKKYIITTPAKTQSIDFSKPLAVKTLNKAILSHYYGIKYWEFPNENLCPAIPGRAEYIHLVADLLGDVNSGNDVTCLDVGTGASCIYPIIGVTDYGWSCIGTEVNKAALNSAQSIINKNPSLKNKVELRHQSNPQDIFNGIVGKDDNITVTICNPPFHGSIADVKRETRRKVRNLHPNKRKIEQNFSGAHHELVYPGGELQFIKTMIDESNLFAEEIQWFTTLISKEVHVNELTHSLENHSPKIIRFYDLITGNKKSRIMCWTFSK